MKEPRLRVIALAVIEHPDRPAVLVSEGYDASRREHFHRLLGGGVEFGERGKDAVRRELHEEIGVDIQVDRFAGVIESIFVYDGRPGHEVALIYEAVFEDRDLYRRDRFDGIEEDPVDAIWRAVGGPCSEVALYPPGVCELLGR